MHLYYKNIVYIYTHIHATMEIYTHILEIYVYTYISKHIDIN